MKLQSLEIVIVVVLILSLAVLPLLTRNQFYLGVGVLICIYSVLAASWDFFSGLTGYLNFGLAFSFGVGAYVAAFVSVTYRLDPAITMLLSGLGSVAFGFLVVAPSLRLRGHFFILVSLLVPIATASFLNYILVQDGSIFGVNQLIGNQLYIYMASFLLFAASLFSFYTISRSKYGLLLRAIKENELAAEACGMKTGRYKIAAFSISSFFAGISGAIYTFSNGVASPTDFSLIISALPVMMSALGGIGTIVGPVLGALILEGLIDLLRINIVQDARLLIASAVLLVVLIYAPGGIWGTLRKKFGGQFEC